MPPHPPRRNLPDRSHSGSHFHIRISVASWEPALAKITRERADALYVHLIMSPYRARILDFTTRNRLPTFVSARLWAESGALMTYGPSQPDIFRRVTTYVDRVLRGAKPGELPIEQPTKFELVINLNELTT